MQELSDRKRTDFFEWIQRQWGLAVEKVRSDIKIEGSPERTLSRAVFQDSSGRLFLIEKFSEKKFIHRRNIADILNHLFSSGVEQVVPCYETQKGEFLSFYGACCFQISPFLKSTGIRRPHYLADHEIGKNFAEFLIRLSGVSKSVENKISPLPFLIQRYIRNLFKRMNQYDPLVEKGYRPVLHFLESGLFARVDELETAFCHGDLHPLNVIWDHGRISSVIDWEFCGVKPAIYDAANLVGCAGIEDPSSLGSPMVMMFLDSLKASGFFSPAGEKLFLDYIIALRFAWLSEWLRTKDEPMIKMEWDYMNLLIANRKTIKNGWQMD